MHRAGNPLAAWAVLDPSDAVHEAWVNRLVHSKHNDTNDTVYAVWLMMS